VSLLSELFPTFTFHLYDSSTKFSFEDYPNITHYNQEFTSDNFEQYKEREDVFLISDIKTPHYNEIFANKMKNQSDMSERKKKEISEQSRNETENTNWEIMKIQQTWILEINPVH